MYSERAASWGSAECRQHKWNSKWVTKSNQNKRITCIASKKCALPFVALKSQIFMYTPPIFFLPYLALPLV